MEMGEPVIEVGPVVQQPGRSEVVYSVTLPSGMIATGPDTYPDTRPTTPIPTEVLQVMQRQALGGDERTG
jgi:hypothetical protein